MLACGLYGKSGFSIECREWVLGGLGPNEALLRVRACGVCGTDLHFLKHMNEFTPLGHEIAGEIEAVGGEVTRLRPGMRAVCEDVTLCGACDMCKSGRIDLCRNGLTLSGQPGMGDYLKVHERMLVPFEGMDFETAAMTEPLAVAIRCVDKLRVSPMQSLLIIGMGSIALLACAYAKLLGAGRIVLQGRSPKSARGAMAEPVARAYGADEVLFDPTEELFDQVLLAAPPSLADWALKRLNYGGTALVCGVTFDEGLMNASIDVNDMVFQKKSLITSLAEPAMDFPLSAKLIANGSIDVSRLITHRISLKDAPRSLEGAYRGGAIKVIIHS